jgi:hypothetical protein
MTLYQLSHLACTTDIWILAWNRHGIYITCLAASINADTTDVCHVMLCHVSYSNYGILYPVVTQRDSTVSCRKYVYHTKYEICLRLEGRRFSNPKSQNSGKWHVSQRWHSPITYNYHYPPSKNNQSQRKGHPVHGMKAYRCVCVCVCVCVLRYGVNRSHPLRSSSDAFCGISFVPFDFQMNFATTVKFKIIFNIWLIQSSCDGRCAMGSVGRAS